MAAVDSEIIDFLQASPDDWFDAEAVTNNIDSDVSEGHVRSRLDHFEATRDDVEDNYWTEEIFGYYFGDNWVPANRENLVRELRMRTSEPVDSMTLSELQSIAEEVGNPAPIDNEHRDFRYDG